MKLQANICLIAMGMLGWAGLSWTAQAYAAELAIHVQDSSGNPVADAVVYAEPVSGKVAAPPSKPLMIEQKGKRFIPLVTAVQTGSVISFPNHDNVRHHVYSFSPAKVFELKLYSGVPTDPVLFDKPGTVVLGCNIHDFMLAFVQVVDTPYFAKTDASGKAQLTDVPNGDYKLKLWHYALTDANKNPEQKISVKDDHAFEFKVELKPFDVPK